MNVINLHNLCQTITILTGLKNDTVVGNLCKIIELSISLDKSSFQSVISLYSKLCSELYINNKDANLSEYLYEKILYDENIFSKKCAKGEFSELSKCVIDAMKNDLSVLQQLSEIMPEEIFSEIEKYDKSITCIFDKLPRYNTVKQDKNNIWSERITEFAEFYKKHGFGEFAKNSFFKVNSFGEIKQILNPDKITLKDLKQYEAQKNKADENIKSFLQSKTNNNVLLYGDRGTGKSSCVKALVNEYKSMGLKLIQIDKSRLKYLSNIMETLSVIPLKFLIFIDDLTFFEEDDNINELKAVLEGSAGIQPENTVIYATSNRRHIIKESFASREGDEIHREDTIDEIMSLSDRFGLMITYQRPDKNNFIEITKELAKDRGLNISDKELAEGAERFALLRGCRSPRIAKQYLDTLFDKTGINK